jgi:hypothetical protein
MFNSAENSLTGYSRNDRSGAASGRLATNAGPAIESNVQPVNWISLASIAAVMDVPVVIATYRSDKNIKTIATHGLDLMNNLAGLAAICDEMCVDRVVVIPDTRTNPEISSLVRHWPNEENCFLVGIPLRNCDGERVGSLCVMNNSRAVARSGISFRKLTEIGKIFSETGQLQAKA